MSRATITIEYRAGRIRARAEFEPGTDSRLKDATIKVLEFIRKTNLQSEGVEGGGTCQER